MMLWWKTKNISEKNGKVPQKIKCTLSNKFWTGAGPFNDCIDNDKCNNAKWHQRRPCYLWHWQHQRHWQYNCQRHAVALRTSVVGSRMPTSREAFLARDLSCRQSAWASVGSERQHIRSNGNGCARASCQSRPSLPEPKGTSCAVATRNLPEASCA